jgi:hypothetical protein
MSAPELARALEGARFRVSLGARALAYPAIAQDAGSGGGDLPKQYYDAMDPFVVLAAAAQVG